MDLQAQGYGPSETPPPPGPCIHTWNVKPCMWYKGLHTCQAETQAEKAQDTQRHQTEQPCGL